ncbi:MAG TPA: tRNA preQ1(34) S-adenosylmethionine ribosyltransferase-isomerase QueA [Spirochaetota bacterium]|nr:tRNA preQ1(34) S-adenosylmethionine ribosyltransferase-isomerase QueA [Spirochaetota bacterium]
MNLSDFDFDLPERLIAQKPLPDRSSSKLLVMDRKKGVLKHDAFSHIDSYLRSGDILIFNNAKVINARLYFIRESGARVEFVLSFRLSDKIWYAISNRTKKLHQGEVLISEKDSSVSINVRGRSGDYVEIETSVSFDEDILRAIGEVPLPPYIRRDAENSDMERYQTVYAKEAGAVAAPTAGLHFTKELIQKINDKGAECAYLTLYVSWGTFSPVRHDDLSLHKMHSEKYFLSETVASKINSARKDGRRVIAVGTTSLRVLESTLKGGENVPGEGVTDIFIHPPYEVRSADCLITNFHTPKSTLLMLVSAFAGYENIMNAYRIAVENDYRFFSYGDSMFIGDL